MNNFLSLVKVEFLSQFGLNKILHSKKSKRLSGLSGLCFFVLLMIAAIAFLGYTYADIFALVLAPTDGIKKLLPVMIAISCLLSFMLSFYTSANVLYGYKDYDLLMSMPIKQSVIVLSKLTFIYVFDLIFALLVVIPSMVVYAGYAAINIGFVLSVLVMAIFSPLLPTALSLFLGALIALISSRFRKKNIVQIIFYLFVFVACFASGFLTGSDMIDPTAMIGKIYFIFPWAVKGLDNVSYLLLYVGANLLPFITISVVCALTYKKMNTLITAKKRAKEFKLKSYGGKTQFGALLNKEIKSLFSNATYTLNALIGPIFGIVGAIAFAIIIRTTIGGYVGEILVFFPAIFAFMFMLAPLTNCSISLEGSAYWIVKTAPISANRFICAKLMVNVIFSVAPAFVAGLVSTIIIGAPYYEVILITFIAVSIAMLGGGVGLMLNLLFPSMNWDNPIKAVKQSLSVFLCILVAMLFAAGLFVIGFFVPLALIYNLLIILGVVLIFNALVYGFIIIKGEKLLSKI
ncbi:MAG: hypothetical protein IJD54_04410 [Clostridia bacterium]|nr:hypothetical protein [Clostridia bacterium]